MKTIEKKYSIHKTVPSKPLVHDYVGRKREIPETRKYSTPASRRKTIEEKITFCLKCKWKFPDRMSVMRKNQHINKCFEGNGELDIMEFQEEKKLKSYAHLPTKKLLKLLICPICGKNFEESNCKAKQNHLQYCVKNI